MDNSFFDTQLGTRKRRRITPAGNIIIACKDCGKLIPGFTSNTTIRTVRCHSCATGEPTPSNVPIVNGMPRPDLMQVSQEELLDAIFRGESEPEPGTVEHFGRKKRKKWSPRDLVAGTFRALGLTQRKKADIDQAKVIYDTVDEESAKEISKRKRRQSIFGAKEQK